MRYCSIKFLLCFKPILLASVLLIVGISTLMLYHNTEHINFRKSSIQAYTSFSADERVHDFDIKTNNEDHSFLEDDIAVEYGRSLVADSNLNTLQKDLIIQKREFESTIKSCLGSYCMSETFTSTQDSNVKIERIGVLSPDDEQVTLLSEILNEWKNKAERSVTMDIASSKHVPAYGYGKNHGWTKIIRFVDHLPSQAFKITLNHLKGSTDSTVDTESSQFAANFEIHVRECIPFCFYY